MSIPWNLVAALSEIWISVENQAKSILMKGSAKSCLLGHKVKEAFKVSIESYTPAC